MSFEQPLAYLILGAPGSGRREILADLLEGTSDEAAATVVLLPEGEAPVEADAQLGTVVRWRWTEVPGIEAAVPEGARRIFFVSEGGRNPIDQIEAFKAWLASEHFELARILCVVHCRLVEQHPPLQVWYDALIHFSDVVLLNRREGVANKWISDFQARYKSQHYPCHVELVKGGRVHNPALILEPQPLRISHAFDPDLQWVVQGPDGQVIEDEDEGEGEDDEEVEMVPFEDPYFVRRNGGPREKHIPEIEKYLSTP